MKLRLGLALSALCSTLLFTFQNCSGTKFDTGSKDSSSVMFTPTASQTIRSSGASSNSNANGDSTSASNAGSNSNGASSGSGAGSNSAVVADCAAGSYEWNVGSQICSASHTLMSGSNSEATLFDNQGPAKGQVSVICSNGNISVKAQTNKTCAVDPVVTSEPQLHVRPLKAVYTPEDPMAIVYTSVKVSEVIYACIQDRTDSSYPCINGDISTKFQEVPRPAQPLSANQELLWSSASFYNIAGIDFTDYEIIFMKKNAAGVLSTVVGSTILSFRLPNELLQSHSGGSYRSSSGPNVFEFVCLDNGGSPPAGYKSYNYFSSRDCYYKISR